MKKVKGSAMVFVLVVSTIGMILASFAIMQFELSLQEEDFYLTNYKLEKNTESGIEYLLATGDIMPYNKTDEVLLGKNENEKISVTRKFWGIYDIGTSAAAIRKKIKSKSVFIGNYNNKQQGLYVSDLNQPVSVCGETRLDGNTFLPEKGVKRAYIEGKNYSGEQLVYGKTSRSSKELPTLSKTRLDFIKNYLNGNFQETDSIISFDLLENDSIVNSFKNRTLVIDCNHFMNLNQYKFSGNIIIHCSDSVKIGEQTELENIMIFCTAANIDKPVNNGFQVFASDKINIEEETMLRYPSALFLLCNNAVTGSDIENQIKVNADCIVYGSVITYKTDKNPRTHVVANIQSGSTVIGEVYSNDYAQISGTVNGSVWCKKTYLKTSSSVYENYLLDTQINGKKKPKGFSGICLENESYQSNRLLYVSE